MCGYLVIDGWSGSQKVPVNIIGETAEDFRIETTERVFLPGRGILKKGQSAFVPKIVVTAEAGEPFAWCADAASAAPETVVTSPGTMPS